MGTITQFPSQVVRVSAPATIASFGPGLNCFGFALKDAPFDIVEASQTSEWVGAKLVNIVNSDDLPYGPQNVVESVAQRMLDISGKRIGVSLVLRKGINRRNGLGGSAASSAAATCAVNEILGVPFGHTSQEIRDAVAYGESIAAAGYEFADNAVPALLGGFHIVTDARHNSFRLDIKPWWQFVIVVPKISDEANRVRSSLNEAPYNTVELTRVARSVLKKFIQTGFVELGVLKRKRRDLLKEGGTLDAVEQYVRGAIDIVNGIRESDPRVFGAGMMADRIITPIRAKSVPGFDRAKKAALEAGAFGFTVCGLGPSVVAITDGLDKGMSIGTVLRAVFMAEGYESVMYVSAVSEEGATLLEKERRHSHRMF